MPRIKENIFENINFSLINDTMTESLQESLEQYWGQDSFVCLQAINEFEEFRDEKIIQGIDFFTSKINVESHRPIIIRLSKDFIKGYFNKTLKSSEKTFNLQSLTPLEIKILNNFSEFLYKRFKDNLISPHTLKLTEKSDKNVNFVFYISLNEGELFQIGVTIPCDRLKLEQLEKNTVFSDDYFQNSSTRVTLHMGTSRITLEELENITPDDIILLENSELTKVRLISGDFEQDFKIKINSSLIVEQDESDDTDNTNEEYNEVIMKKNLWDDIQIEVNAEFEKVKMTIGELKQITQGQIIDLGSIFKNEISLFVEDKKVAKGELIIINDKYAVRLNEVLSQNTGAIPAHEEPSAKPDISDQPKPAPKNDKVPQRPPQGQPRPQPRPAQGQARPQPRPVPAGAKPAPKKPESEEFDYSDFEK